MPDRQLDFGRGSEAPAAKAEFAAAAMRRERPASPGRTSAGASDLDFERAEDRRRFTKTVILRESGVSSTLRPFDSIIDVSEYWVARLSLSSGGHSADPLA